MAMVALASTAVVIAAVMISSPAAPVAERLIHVRIAPSKSATSRSATSTGSSPGIAQANAEPVIIVGQPSATALIANALTVTGPRGVSAGRPGPQPIPAAPFYPLVLTALDYRSCPAAATACVDLAEHLTWLQSNGKVSFGPVQMEPGPPGSAHATPRGTFQVAWKAGKNFISNIYNEPMPYATFFAPGGIAFHGGSLTKPSHGCVHLTVANALYYNTHLAIGAEVVVF